VKVTALEIPASFDRARENLELVDALLARAPTDLALLPEASLTGYVSPQGDFDLTRFAEPRDYHLCELDAEGRLRRVGPDDATRGDPNFYLIPSELASRAKAKMR